MAKQKYENYGAATQEWITRVESTIRQRLGEMPQHWQGLMTLLAGQYDLALNATTVLTYGTTNHAQTLALLQTSFNNLCKLLSMLDLTHYDDMVADNDNIVTHHFTLIPQQRDFVNSKK